MPILRSARKKMRQDIKKTTRNNREKTHLRQSLRKFSDALKENKSPAELTPLLRDAYKRLDLASKKNLIHPRNAARNKSRLAKSIPQEKSN